MAKTTAPLLSFSARGQIAKVQVYSTWKGRNYARVYTTPANPDTTSQREVRSVFSWLQAAYKVAPALVTAPWAAYAQGKVLTDRNAFGKFNIAPLQGETDLDNLILSPGALGGLPPIAVTPTPGSGQISLAIDAPTVIPDGWTINMAVAAVVKDQDPQTETEYTITAGSDSTSTYAVVLTGLDAVLYQCRAWLVWNRPDGKLAYSPELATTSTPS